MKRSTASLALVLCLLTAALPRSSHAAPRAAPPPARPAVAPLQAPKGPGEIVVNVYGLTPQQVAGNRLPAMFQLFLAGTPVFSQFNFVSGFTPAVPARGMGGEVTAYSEGEALHIRGLPAGVYDLHFTRGNPGSPQIRPLHINGIVVEPGKPTQLEDVHLELGETLVQIGSPTILPTPAVNVVDRFNALLEQFNALQARVDQLEKANAELQRRLDAQASKP